MLYYTPKPTVIPPHNTWRESYNRNKCTHTKCPELRVQTTTHTLFLTKFTKFYQLLESDILQSALLLRRHVQISLKIHYKTPTSRQTTFQPAKQQMGDSRELAADETAAV